MVTRKTRSAKRTTRKAPRGRSTRAMTAQRTRGATTRTTARRTRRMRTATALQDMTRAQLYRRAKGLKIAGRSLMRKQQLIEAIRRAGG